jgi:hypothetical protein
LSHRYKDLPVTNSIVADYWVFVIDGIKWSEQLRYQSGFTRSQAELMLESINNGSLKIKRQFFLIDIVS